MPKAKDFFLKGFVHDEVVKEIDQHGKLQRSYPKYHFSDNKAEPSGLQRIMNASTPGESGLHRLFSA